MKKTRMKTIERMMTVTNEIRPTANMGEVTKAMTMGMATKTKTRRKKRKKKKRKRRRKMTRTARTGDPRRRDPKTKSSPTSTTRTRALSSLSTAASYRPIPQERIITTLSDEEVLVMVLVQARRRPTRSSRSRRARTTS